MTRADNNEHVAIVGTGRYAQKLATTFLDGNCHVTLAGPDTKKARAALNKIGEQLSRKFDVPTTLPPTSQVLQRIRIASDMHRLNRHDVVFVIDDSESLSQDDLAENLLLLEASVALDTPIATFTLNPKDVDFVLQAAPDPRRIVPFQSLLPDFEGSVVLLMTTPQVTPGFPETVARILEDTDITVIHTKSEQAESCMDNLIAGWVSEPCKWLDDGKGDVETIDRIFGLSTVHNLGPLQLADLIGLDVVRAILQRVSQTEGCEHHAPSSVLNNLVQNGHLGWKTGHGFYVYNQTTG